MLLLAFDTATPAITAALHDGTAVLATDTEIDARRHGELLAPVIARVLERAGRSPEELTHVVVGVGPGPFTGLRVGLVTARALSAALGIAIHGVCTLDVLAYASGSAGPFAVATDARRREVYWARYADARTRLGDPGVDRPTAVAEQLAGLPVVGAGAVLYPESLPQAAGPVYPSADALACLAVERLAADGAGLLPPNPLYLRRPDAVEPRVRKQVTPG